MRKPLVTTVLILSILGVAPFSASLEAADHKISVQDACDPATFDVFGDAFFGQPNSCPSGQGPVTVGEFIDAIITQGGHDDWRFDPAEIQIEPGDTVTFTNEGGGRHRVREVANFGSGTSPEINELMGLPPVPPEPTVGGGIDELLQPGDSITVSGLANGEHKFLCTIHPWMQTVVLVQDFQFFQPGPGDLPIGQ